MLKHIAKFIISLQNLLTTIIRDKVLWLKRKASNKYEEINFQLQMALNRFNFLFSFHFLC